VCPEEENKALPNCFGHTNWEIFKKALEIKGIVHSKMRISHEVILGVYDILLSDEYNQSYI